jgi:hypothetical protein
MPRYFFNIMDGHCDPDLTGTDLPDIYAAQGEAIRASGEMLSEIGPPVLGERYVGDGGQGRSGPPFVHAALLRRGARDVGERAHLRVVRRARIQTDPPPNSSAGEKKSQMPLKTQPFSGLSPRTKLHGLDEPFP